MVLTEPDTQSLRHLSFHQILQTDLSSFQPRDMYEVQIVVM